MTNINNKKIDIFFIIHIFIVSFFGIISQFLFKKSHIKYPNQFNLNILIGIFIYTIIGYSTYKILNYGSIFSLNIISHLLYFFVLFLISYYYFNEKITFKKLLACFFGIASLVLFFIEGVH